jgi:hypothetical protein
MRYAYVENGVVKESNRPLPISWANISNFNLFDNETLKQYGWFPYRFVSAHFEPDEVIDSSYFSIEENEVVEYQTKRKLNDYDLEERSQNMWVNIRSRRNIELMESDWTQVIDSPFTPEKKEEWKVYRQALRDITLHQDPFNIVWPVKPSNEEVILEETINDTLPEQEIVDEQQNS